MTSDDLRLDGKVALVTGASKGIGAAISCLFAEHGARVMLFSRKADVLASTAEAIDGDTAVYAGNAGNPEDIRACVEATLTRFGSLDILVNNAATNPHYGPMIDMDLAQLDKIYEVNLKGAFVCIQEAWRRYMASHGGSILNISSVGGLQFSGPIGAYDVSKAALIHMTRHLASELGPGTRVNAIAPGLVKTDFARPLWENGDPSAAWSWPLKRLGEPLDVARAALYLASDYASWVTGEVLVVDGGAVLQSSLLAGGRP